MDASQIDAAIYEAGRLAMQPIGKLQPQVEPMDEDRSDISESLLEEQRRFRYRFIPVEEASDPELWMDVPHGGPESSSDSSMNNGESNNEPAAEPLTGKGSFSRISMKWLQQETVSWLSWLQFTTGLHLLKQMDSPKKRFGIWKISWTISLCFDGVTAIYIHTSVLYFRD